MIRVINGGQLLTGEEEFLIQQHSGHTPDLTDDIEEKLTDYEADLLDGGDWVMVIDGCPHLIEEHPEFIRVTGDEAACVSQQLREVAIANTPQLV